MLTVLRNFINSVVLAGSSYDTKPLNVGNGSVFREVDTGKEYWFDAENKVWTPAANTGVSPTTPAGPTYFLKVAVKDGVSYATGDALDPTDFTVYITDSNGDTVDTVKDSVLSDMALAGDAKALTMNDGTSGLILGLLNETEEYVCVDVIEKAADDIVIARAFPVNGQFPVSIPSTWLVNGTSGITLEQNKAYRLTELTISVGIPVYHLGLVRTGSAPSVGDSFGLGSYEVRILDADDVVVNTIATTGDYSTNMAYTENGLCSQTMLAGETSQDNVLIKMYCWNATENQYTSLENMVAGNCRIECTVFKAGGVYPTVLTSNHLADTTQGDITILNRRLADAMDALTVSNA